MVGQCRQRLVEEGATGGVGMPPEALAIVAEALRPPAAPSLEFMGGSGASSSSSGAPSSPCSLSSVEKPSPPPCGVLSSVELHCWELRAPAGARAWEGSCMGPALVLCSAVRMCGCDSELLVGKAQLSVLVRLLRER